MIKELLGSSGCARQTYPVYLDEEKKKRRHTHTHSHNKHRMRWTNSR